MHDRVQLLAGLDAGTSVHGRTTARPSTPRRQPRRLRPAGRQAERAFDRKMHPSAGRLSRDDRPRHRPPDPDPGGRVDYFGEIDTLDRRPAAQRPLQLLEGTTLKGGVGLFTQAPDFGESRQSSATRTSPSRALHYGLGVEQQLGERLQLTWKASPSAWGTWSSEQPPGENLNNDGIGRICGASVGPAEAQPPHHRLRLVHAVAQPAQRPRRAAGVCSTGTRPTS